METGVEAFAKGYAAMGAVREDMASQDILKNLYAGQDPAEIAKDPTKAATALNQASAIASQRGYASLAHSFQKQAGDLSKNVQEQQLGDIKVKQSRLNYADQMLQGLPDEASNEQLTNAFASITDETAQMHIQAIIRNDKIPQPQKKQLLDRMSKTVSQNLAADGLALKGELGEAKLEIEQQKLLLREKNAAGKQGNLKPAKGFEIKGTESVLKSMYGKDLIEPMSDEDWTAAATRVESRARKIAKEQNIDLEDAKQAAMEEVFKSDIKEGGWFSSDKEGYKYDKGTVKPTPVPGAKKEAPKTSKKELAGQDKQALEWAKKNPKDPRAAAILKKLGQ
jgi:hypothetical protein